MSLECPARLDLPKNFLYGRSVAVNAADIGGKCMDFKPSEVQALTRGMVREFAE